MLKQLFANLHAADNPDLSDGAWWATLEDTVNEFNRINGTDYDPHNTVLQYVLAEETF